jgi:hypothetical protein
MSPDFMRSLVSSQREAWPNTKSHPSFVKMGRLRRKRSSTGLDFIMDATILHGFGCVKEIGKKCTSYWHIVPISETDVELEKWKQHAG